VLDPAPSLHIFLLPFSPSTLVSLFAGKMVQMEGKLTAVLVSGSDLKGDDGMLEWCSVPRSWRLGGMRLPHPPTIFG